jgi:hypothetical protein
MIPITEFAIRAVFCLATIPWAFDPALIRAARPAPTHAPARAGLVIEVDPPAGQPSVAADPSDVARQVADDAALARSTDGLTVQVLADGSRRVDLQGRFRSYSVVTIAADGSLTMACADDPVSALGIARAAALRLPAEPGPRTARTSCAPREE